jgi:hypothetical protein
MKRIGIFVLGAGALLLSACDEWVGIRGNGHMVTDRRPIAEFTEIAASGGVRIEWQSGPPALTITTDENLLPYIDNHISGNMLRLHNRDRVRPTHGIKVMVSSAKLNGADLSGAVDLIARNVSGPKFYVRARGASDITIDGNVEEFLGDLSGATDLRAEKLQTKAIALSSTGASSARVSVSDALRVSITGAGDVTYFGNPKTIEKHITGAGSVHHKD